MKNSKLRRLLAVVIAFAIVLTTCGLGTIVFATTPDVVVNDGTGSKTGSLHTYTASYVDNDVTGGKAINLTKNDANVGMREGTINVNNVGNPEDITAISMYVEFPDLGAGNAYYWSLRLHAYAMVFKGDWYAITKDGEFVGKNINNFYNGFKGTIVFVMPEDDETLVWIGWDTTQTTLSGSKTYPYNTNVTKKQFFDDFGKISALKIYANNGAAMQGKAVVVDEVTYHFETGDDLLNEFNLMLEAPEITTSGLFTKGGEAPITVAEGTEVYYTLDGTVPSKTNGVKYSEETIPVVNEACTLKAIAYKGDTQSLVVSADYTLLDENYPNVTVINDASNTSKLMQDTKYEGVAAKNELVENYSPYGTAVRYTGTGSSGESMWNVTSVTSIPKAEIAAFEAFGMWVSAPYDFNLHFSPCINNQKNAFKGGCITYNTSTGEVKEYANHTDAKLSNFEGYVLFLPKGECVRDTWSNSGTFSTWREFMMANGLAKLTFYHSHSAYSGKTFVVDNFVAVVDVDKFIEELKTETLRPTAPSATLSSGIVAKDEKIELVSNEGAEIYYTLDGTIPTTDSQKYGTDNMPTITVTGTTLKVMATMNGITSGVNEYLYDFLDPSIPNVAVINDADDATTIANVSNWEGLSTSRRQVEGVSPYGKAIEITGTNSANKGSLLFVKNFDTSSRDVLAVKGALAYWINVPIGKDITFNPCINDERYPLYCDKITYNAYTGEIKEYTADEKVVLNGFEGYVIFKLTGNCVRNGYPDKEGNAEYITWRQFAKTNGMTQLIFYMNDLSFYNKTFTVDRFVLITDVDKFIEEDAKTLDKRPLAPTSEINGGIVSKGEVIPFVALEGTEIYYTTDGTTPDKNSTKYDDSNKPVITTSPTVIKAVAYDENADVKYSLVTEYEFKFLDDSVPNSTVINDVDDIETLGEMGTYGGSTERDHNDVMSMFGKALTIIGINPVNKGSLMSFKNIDTSLSVDELAAHQALAFWVSIPSGTTMGFTPRFNGEQYVIKNNAITYNTSTGEIIEYKAGEQPQLEGFEGFIIYKLEGDCVRTTWSEDSYVSWRKFVKSNGLKNIMFYFNDKAIYRKTFTLDRFTMVVDVDKFLEELEALPKRPLAPTADPGSDAVRENTQIFLHSATGTKIVYTKDGTIPTVDAEGNITNGTLYTTYSMGNGQEDASYIELREAVTIKAIAVNLENNVSGVATFNYTIEPEYTGPNVVVLNNGTGEGNNTWSWLSDAVFEKEIVDNNSPDGKGIRATLIDPTQKSTVQEMNFKVDTEGVEQIHNAQGFTFHLTVPDLGQAALKMGFQPRVSGTSNYLKVDTYAISDDGETVLKNVNNFNNFSGTIYCVIQEPVAVQMNYGKVDKEWYKFVKENSLTSFGFYYTCSKKAEGIDPALEYYFEFDELSLVYDTEQLFKDINLDGLLATYDAGTFENTNMIVTNDGSGNAKNVGLAGFTDGLVIEKTNYSLDERSLKLTMPKGESFINFMSTSTEEELIIGDGAAFWVEMPKGAGDTTLDLALHDNNAGVIELYDYADRWYYLIDKDGVIAKREGALVVPDGFRGWIVVPKVSLFLTLSDNFTIDNAELDFNQVSNVIVTFCNKNSELTGKTVHIDDISFYTDFTALVQSRAIKWEGQVFE